MADEVSRTRLPPPWPWYEPFEESERDTYSAGVPDFPATAGGREQGKFRPSGRPLLTTIAVVNDDGTPIASGFAPVAEPDGGVDVRGDVEGQMLLMLKATVLGLSLLTGVDLINSVSE